MNRLFRKATSLRALVAAALAVAVFVGLFGRDALARTGTQHRPENSIAVQVTSVTDGDSFRGTRRDGTVMRVRLWGIDAPERDQDHGPQATAALRSLLAGGTAFVSVRTTDRYGRAVGLVHVPHRTESVNERLVATGLAWVHHRWCNTDPCGTWRRIQRMSAGRRIGLWSGPAVPPWEHRARKRQTR